MTHAVNSWAAAVSATIALVLLTASACSCHFVSIQAADGENLEILDTSEQINATSASLGVYCPAGFYNLHDDGMWILSATFLTLALALGCISAAIAWAVCLFTTPTKALWQTISVTAAVSAVLCVPGFLLFNAEPCSDFPQQSCEFSGGAYSLVTSLVFWIVSTIITQFLDPPDSSYNIREWPLLPTLRGGRRENQSDGLSFVARLRRWVPLDKEEKEAQPELKVDKTMLEDEEDGLLVGGVNQQDGAIEVTEAQAAATIGETMLEDRSENNPDARNEVTSVTPVSGDSVDIRDFMTITPLYSSSLIRADDSKESPMPDFDSEPKETTDAVDPGIRTESSTVTILSGDPGFKEMPRGDAYQSPNVAETRALADDDDYYDDDDEDDDLGSLEPTVVEVTGEESILDGDRENQLVDVAPAVPIHKQADASDSAIGTKAIGEVMQADAYASKVPASAVSTKVGEVMQKVIQTPVDLGLAVISKAKEKRRRRILKGYKLMDDSDIESSYPMSPPLEILTLNISRDVDLDLNLNPVTPTTQKEQDLLDEWNAMHRRPPVAQAFSDEPEPDLDSSDDDSSGDRVFENKGSVDDSEERIKLTIDGVSPIKKSDGNLRKKRRSRRSRQFPSARSVASATSLLSFTIAEETADDLEPSDSSVVDTPEKYEPRSTTLNPVPFKRSRSAPTLAGFSRQNMHAGNVYDDIHMTGINSYHTATIFRRTDESSKSSREKHSGRSSGSSEGSSATGPRGWKRLVPPSLSSASDKEVTARTATKKVSMFRKERALREGIHLAQSYVSDPSSSEDNQSSSSARIKRSRKARQARLKRLQGHTNAAVSATPTGGDAPDRTLQGQPQSLAKTQPNAEVVTPTRDETSSCSPPRSGSTVKSTGTVGSEGSRTSKSFDSGSYYIDMLDVQLAELNRPDGAQKGPDEESL
jgi:hypothetical protein